MRDNINVNSSLKLFESYRNFSGGLNTQQSNEMIRDNQTTIAENVDLSITSSIKKRTGRTLLVGTHTGWAVTSPIQGLFKFVNNAETVLIAAVEGKLFYARPSGTSYGNWTQISITDAGSAFTFQTTDAVEAVQYGEWLYVATGTKFVRAKVYLSAGSPVATAETVVDQYKPTVQEALYIGTNALNTDPASYIVDDTTGSAGTLSAVGIKISSPYFTADVANNLTMYVKTSSTDLPTVQYAWSYKLSSETTWTNAPGYHPHSTAYKTYPFSIHLPGTYDVKCEAKLGSATAEYILYGVRVTAIAQQPILPSTNIQKCRKILLHWDRIILYDPKPSSTDGSTNQQDQIFISHVGEPRYFPSPNVISFAADTQQRVRKVVRYRNILLIFTPDTIQSLAGKAPSDYVRSLVNNQLGAIWGNSVQVVENDVYFVSKQGIYAVRPNVYTQDNFNVASLDTLIMDQFAEDFVVSDSLAGSGLAENQVTSVVFDNQYILYGTNNKIYRHYYDRKAWVVDNLSHLLSTNVSVRFGTPIIASFNNEQTVIEPIIKYNTSTPAVTYGEFCALDNSVYTDLGIAYTMKLRTKYFDLSYAFNFKKLRKIHVLAHVQNYPIDLAVKIEADSTIILDPEVGSVVVDAVTGAVTWTLTSVPNFIFDAGTYPATAWELGSTPLGDIQLAVIKTNIRAKCRRVRVTFQHSEGSPCEIYGFGLEFRAKRP